MVERAETAVDAILSEVAPVLRVAPRQEMLRPCVYHLQFTGPGGGDCWIRIEGGLASTGRGVPERSDCRLTLSVGDAVRMIHSPGSALGMFFAGRIQVRGDVGAAGRLGQLLRPRRRPRSV